MIKDFQLKVKALDDSGTFTGLASTYGPPADLTGDIIEPGAYRNSIASQGAGIPLLFAHDQSQPIGLARLSDSPAGLVCHGTLVMDDPAAKRAYSHLKAGSLKSLSIGYSLPNDPHKVTYSSDGNTRSIKEVRLWEVSLVACPANLGATITSVKSISQIETLLRGVKPGDVDAVLMEQLLGIDAELRQLLKLSTKREDDLNLEQEADDLAALKSFAADLKTLLNS